MKTKSEFTEKMELTDEKLKSVTAGIKYVITELNVGDTFINLENPDKAVVILEDITDMQDNTPVKAAIYWFFDNKWQLGIVHFVYFFDLSNFYVYSHEMTGKLPIPDVK